MDTDESGEIERLREASLSAISQSLLSYGWRASWMKTDMRRKAREGLVNVSVAQGQEARGERPVQTCADHRLSIYSRKFRYTAYIAYSEHGWIGCPIMCRRADRRQPLRTRIWVVGADSASIACRSMISTRELQIIILRSKQAFSSSTRESDDTGIDRLSLRSNFMSRSFGNMVGSASPLHSRSVIAVLKCVPRLRSSIEVKFCGKPPSTSFVVQFRCIIRNSRRRSSYLVVNTIKRFAVAGMLPSWNSKSHSVPEYVTRLLKKGLTSAPDGASTRLCHNDELCLTVTDVMAVSCDAV